MFVLLKDSGIGKKSMGQNDSSEVLYRLFCLA